MTPRQQEAAEKLYMAAKALEEPIDTLARSSAAGNQRRLWRALADAITEFERTEATEMADALPSSNDRQKVSARRNRHRPSISVSDVPVEENGTPEVSKRWVTERRPSARRKP